MVDRLIRRAMRHLAPAEGLVASAVGYEQGGRRRQVVLATDRRVIVAPVRPAPPRELDYRELAAAEASDGALVITTVDGDDLVVERIHDPSSLHLLAELLRGRVGAPAGHHAPTRPKVRIVTG